jgi:hypothetical protein
MIHDTCGFRLTSSIEARVTVVQKKIYTVFALPGRVSATEAYANLRWTKQIPQPVNPEMLKIQWPIQH